MGGRRGRGLMTLAGLVLGSGLLTWWSGAVGTAALGGRNPSPMAVLVAGTRPDDPWPYRWPVLAPVVDPFRPPSTPYGPGNRGVEMATTPGQTVVAAREGRVTFAGPVAGSLYVTVLHPDGVRTSYAYLASITVTRGQVVAAGQPLGTTGSRFHVGARIGDAYVDPAILFGGRGAGRVWLVPVPR